MSSVFTREFGNYFHTIIGYLFLSIFLFVCGYGFVFGNLTANQASMFIVINRLMNVLYLLIPILTMRIFSEELRAGTDRLLFTSPLSSVKIVLGKYFAAMAVILIATVCSLVFPVIMFIYGNPYIGEVVLAYLGFLLLAGTLVSVGVFISSLTEHQFASCILTFLAVILLMMSGAFIPRIESQILVDILSWFAVFIPFNYFASGILRLDAVLYYLSFTTIFLVLTHVSLRRRLAGR